ncbi:MAG TPA: hypothetical protein VG319_08650 [Polyangia bacterium]|jgi:hypothetical protein|nr:hypothetical protein [Polyangia bacterium]
MKIHKGMLTLSTAVVVAVAGLATPAFAEDTAPPPVTENAPAAPRARHGDVAGGGLGIGAAAFISGLFGPEVVYDFGQFHVEGLLAFSRQPVNNGGNAPTGSVFQFGVGGWYHLHIGENSDFSAGGVFGLRDESPAGGGNSLVGFEIEPGVMIRAFITPNVALHGRAGFVLAFGDQTGPLLKQLSLDGQITGGLGITYFFR